MLPIEGQCVVQQMLDFFFKYSKLPYESHLSGHTSEPLKKM